MNKSDGPTQYSTARTFAILLLLWGLSLPERVAAQACDAAKERIYRITESEAQQVPDSLETLLDLASFVRDCEDEVSLDLELWLLINEVFAFDKLGRYAEASRVVDHFFEIYFEQGSAYYRARFHLWRLHLNALAGAVVEMIRDYAEAQHYAHALDPINQAHLHTNGAYAYMEINEHETALRLTQQAQDLIGTPETYDERMAVARALLVGAEAQLRLSLPLPRLERELHTASRLYGELGDTAKVAIATTLLGMAYAAEGDTTRALGEMTEAAALAQAQRAGSLRSQAHTLYRQGQLLRRHGDFRAAEPILLQALDAAQAHREFYQETACELALLYEQRRLFDKAKRYYQVVVEAPNPSGFVAMLKAQRQTEVARARLVLIESQQQQQRLHLALVGLLLLIALTGSGLVFLWRRPRRLADALQAKSNGSFLPRRTHTGMSLDQLTDYFRDAGESSLLGLHLAYIFATLFEPELILPYLDDPWHIEHVKQGTLPTNAALFRCVAAAEEALVAGQRFGKNPANMIGSYLNGEFGKRGWVKPANPSMWREYFVAHHMEDLL